MRKKCLLLERPRRFYRSSMKNVRPSRQISVLEQSIKYAQRLCCNLSHEAKVALSGLLVGSARSGLWVRLGQAITPARSGSLLQLGQAHYFSSVSLGTLARLVCHSSSISLLFQLGQSKYSSSVSLLPPAKSENILQLHPTLLRQFQ